MNCKIHNQPKTMVCAGCADTMCAMCAEYIDGNWFCQNCAIRERKIAAGMNLRDIMAVNLMEQNYSEETGDTDFAEV